MGWRIDSEELRSLTLVCRDMNTKQTLGSHNGRSVILNIEM